MEIKQTHDQIEVIDSNESNNWVGWWFIGMGVASLVLMAFLRIKPGEWSLVPLVAGASIVVGAIPILIRARQNTVISSQGTITITSTRFIGGKSTFQTFDATDVKNVEYSVVSGPDPTENSLKYNNIHFNLKDGLRVRIGSQPLTKPALTKKVEFGSVHEAARQISEFLSVPLDDDLNKWRPLA